MQPKKNENMNRFDERKFVTTIILFNSVTQKLAIYEEINFNDSKQSNIATHTHTYVYIYI